MFLVLIFGEIIPSALFTGPNQLHVAYNLKCVIVFLMYFLYPIAYPISLLLDKVFGDGTEAPSKMSRNELEALMTIQSRLIDNSPTTSSTEKPSTLDKSAFIGDYTDLEDGQSPDSETTSLQRIIPLERTKSYSSHDKQVEDDGNLGLDEVI